MKDSSEIIWQSLYTILCLISMVFSLIIPLMYLFHPKTRQHPSMLLILLIIRLLLVICLAEFSQIYHGLVAILIYQMGSVERLSIMEYFPQYLQLNLFDLIELNNVYVILCLQLQVFFYMAWCIDLILTLNKPFLRTKIRLLIEVPVACLLTFVLSCIEFKILLLSITNRVEQDQGIRQEKLELNLILRDILIAVVSIFVLVLFSTTIICFQAIQRTIKKQNQYTRDIKIKYLTQQAIFQILVIILTSCGIILILGPDYTVINVPSLVNHFLFCIFLSQGIILGTLRLSEKFFRQQLLKSIYKFLKIKNYFQITENEQANEVWNIPLSILLKKIQSQELMTGILKSITMSVVNYEERSHNRQDLKELSNIVFTIQNRGSLSPEQETMTSHEQEQISESLLIQEQQIKMKVIQYAPATFAQLRETDNIYGSNVKKSLSVTQNLITLNQLSESVGKSGSLFFMSYDHKFIIKTLNQSELDFLLKILPKYRSFILQNNQSLLARIYGCYTVQIKNVAPVYLILMENTFQRNNGPFNSYDMKGSLIGRTSEDLKYGKDQDFLQQNQIFITLQKEITQVLQDQITKDSEFLKDLNIMDYSLLLGVWQEIIESRTRESNHTQKIFRCIFDQLNNKQYSFGIIDYLQEFDNQKYIENRYKSLFNLEKLISSIQPQQYSYRFITFLNSIICSAQTY